MQFLDYLLIDEIGIIFGIQEYFSVQITRLSWI